MSLLIDLIIIHMCRSLQIGQVSSLWSALRPCERRWKRQKQRRVFCIWAAARDQADQHSTNGRIHQVTMRRLFLENVADRLILFENFARCVRLLCLQ